MPWIRLLLIFIEVCTAASFVNYYLRKKGKRTVSLCPGKNVPHQPGTACAGLRPCTCPCPVCSPQFGRGSGGSGSAIGGIGGSGSAIGGIGGSGGGGGGSAGAWPLTSNRFAVSSPRASRAGMAGFGERDFAFAAGSVRGIRSWSIPQPPLHQNPRTAGWPESAIIRLRGLTGCEWGPGVQEAVCNNDSRHQPPVEWDEKSASACGCGYWAYWDIQGGSMSSSPGLSLAIAGIIEGTGRVIIGERGFRSQLSRIIALAPAFSIQARQGGYSDGGPGPYGNDPYGNDPYGNDPYGNRYGRLAPGTREEAQQNARRELEEAQQNAGAWMGIIRDTLQALYPDAKIYATVTGMLACERTGEIEPGGEAS